MSFEGNFTDFKYKLIELEKVLGKHSVPEEVEDAFYQMQAEFYGHLSDDIEKAIADLDSMQDDISELSRHSDDLKDDIIELEAELDNAQSEIATLESELEHATREL